MDQPPEERLATLHAAKLNTHSGDSSAAKTTRMGDAPKMCLYEDVIITFVFHDCRAALGNYSIQEEMNTSVLYELGEHRRNFAYSCQNYTSNPNLY